MKKTRPIDSDRKRLLKYFRVFLCLVILIAITLSVVLYTYTEHLIRSESVQNDLNSFRLLKHQHETTFQQLEQTLHVLFDNSEYLFFMDDYDEKRVSKMMKTINELNSTRNSMRMIEDICIFYPSRAYTLSYRQTVAKVEMRHDYDFLIQYSNESSFIGYRTYVRTVTYPFAYTPTTVVTLVKSLGVTGQGITPAAFIVIDLSFDSISSPFRELVMDNGSSLLIYDAGGTLISHIGQEYRYEALTAPGFTISEDFLAAEQELGGVNCNIYYSSLPGLGWTYYYVHEAADLMQKLANIRYTVIAVFALCVVVGVVYSWSLSKHLLKPLQRISAHLGDQSVDIYDRIDSMIHQNEALNDELDQNRETERSYAALRRILQGSEGADNQLVLRDGEKECVFCMLSSKSEDNLSVAQINQALSTLHIRLIAKLYSGQGDTALLLAAQAFTDEILAGVATTVKRIFGSVEPVSIGFSNPFSEATMIHSAFDQAQIALGMNVVRGKGSVCFYNHLQNTAHLDYPYKLETAILRAFRDKDTERIADGIRSFERYLIEADARLQTVREFYVQLFCTCQRLVFDLPNTAAEAVRGYSHLVLVEGTELNAMSDYILDMLNVMMDCTETPQSDDHEIIGRICDYIDSHLAEAPSLETLSAEFFMSPSALRNEFSKVMGMSVKTYSDLKRIQLAKKLLAESEEKVQDIAVRIGFTYVQSFIPFFKNSTGMTPGEYRQMVHKQKILERDEK